MTQPTPEIHFEEVFTRYKLTEKEQSAALIVINLLTLGINQIGNSNSEPDDSEETLQLWMEMQNLAMQRFPNIIPALIEICEPIGDKVLALSVAEGEGRKKKWRKEEAVLRRENREFRKKFRG